MGMVLVVWLAGSWVGDPSGGGQRAGGAVSQESQGPVVLFLVVLGRAGVSVGGGCPGRRGGRVRGGGLPLALRRAACGEQREEEEQACLLSDQVPHHNPSLLLLCVAGGGGQGNATKRSSSTLLNAASWSSCTWGEEFVLDGVRATQTLTVTCYAGRGAADTPGRGAGAGRQAVGERTSG